MRVLLTNDDGIDMEGLEMLRRALVEIPGIDLRVVAPDGNRSAMARSITISRPLWVAEFEFEDGSIGYATDGTPVDCVRIANLGLIDGWLPEMVVSGINHGSNIGDDITYSGTVAAALEAIVLGLPGIAVSQQSLGRELDFRRMTEFDFNAAATFTARLVGELAAAVPGGPGGSIASASRTLLNINFPGCEPQGVAVTRLGRRYYTDELEVLETDATDATRKRYRVYGQAAEATELEPGTDITAIAEDLVSVTPLQFDLTHHDGVQSLVERDLERLLREPAEPQS